MNYKFSIVTVNLNNAKGLIETNASLRAQTYRNFEWIIIDGCSTDETSSIVPALSNVDLYVSERDEGIYDAMNKGVRRATGKFVLFLNSGDALANEKTLDILSNEIGNGSPVMVFGDTIEVSDRGEFYKVARSPFWNFYSMFTHHQSIVYNTEQVRNMPYDLAYKLSADWVLTTRLIRQRANCIRVKAPISRFMRGGLSYSESARATFDEELLRVYVYEHELPVLIAKLIWTVKVCANRVRATFPKFYDKMRFKALAC